MKKNHATKKYRLGIPLVQFHENGIVLFAAGAVCVVLTTLDLVMSVKALPFAIMVVGAIGMVLGAFAWRTDRVR